MMVIGLDGCKGGWVVVAASESGFEDIFVAPDIAAAERVALARWGIETIVVDMPIGLADTDPRLADDLARAMLGKRQFSVFDVPIRSAIEAGSQPDASRISKLANGRGVGSMSYALRDKILEVDEFMSRRTVPVFEGHPEVSFAALAQGHLRYYKKTLLGALERRRLLESVNMAPPMEAEIELKKVAFDDIHDAAAMAWTALRAARGEAQSLPSPPEQFSDGIPSAIWY